MKIWMKIGLKIFIIMRWLSQWDYSYDKKDGIKSTGINNAISLHTLCTMIDENSVQTEFPYQQQPLTFLPFHVSSLFLLLFTFYTILPHMPYIMCRALYFLLLKAFLFSKCQNKLQIKTMFYMSDMVQVK